MDKQLKQDLQDLSQEVGIPSREGRVVKLLQKKIGSLADDIKIDILGNLIVTLK